MRAAFLAVQSGKQVGVLVPTTLLAQQHQESFRDRFADWPVRVEVLSRFQSAREVREIVAGLRPGRASPAEITICDLAGTGAQDTAIADHAAALLGETGTVMRA